MSNEKEQAMPGSAPLPPPQSNSAPNGSSAPPGFPQQPPPYSPYAGPPGMGQVPFAYFPPPGTHMMPPGAMYPGAPPMAPPPYDPKQPQQAGPPPPTAAYPYVPFAGQAYPGHPYFFPGYMPGQPPMIYPAYPMVHQAPPPPNMAVVMPDGFDASARFDGVARPAIPPPPPGVAPNMAQLAMLYGQGNQVIVGQKKASFF